MFLNLFFELVIQLFTRSSCVLNKISNSLRVKVSTLFVAVTNTVKLKEGESHKSLLEGQDGHTAV